MLRSSKHKDHGAMIAALFGISRSPEWPKTQKAHLKKEPHCVACRQRVNQLYGLQVHHIFPFHYCISLGRPDLELDQRNLITLCETEAGHKADNHHLLIGHLDDFESSNLSVSIDARKTFFGMTEAQIKSNPQWRMKKVKRLKPLDKMTAKDKGTFKALMNKIFPKK